MRSRKLSIILATVLGLGTVGFVGCGGSSSTITPSSVFGFQSSNYNTTVVSGVTTAVDVNTVNPTEASVAYTLTGANAADFTIGADGVITFNNPSTIGTYTFIVTASTAGETDITQSITIVVADDTPEVTRELLKTGQTTDYEATLSTEDGDLYTEIGVQKSYTPIGGNIIQDNVTGLRWYDFNDNNGGALWTYAEATAYCTTGSTMTAIDGGGWRVPTIEELKTLVDYGRNTPAVNPMFLSIDPLNDYWSSTDDRDLGGTLAPEQIGINFDDGDDQDSIFESNSLNVLCVKGDALPTAGTFDTSTWSDGTNSYRVIIDTSTNLMWVDEAIVTETAADGWIDQGVNPLLPGAMDFCEAVGDGWRLPNINELYSLADRSKSPAINELFTSGMFGAGDYYWSSTTWNSIPTGAWIVNFTDDGIVDDSGDFKTSQTRYVRCVRNAN